MSVEPLEPSPPPVLELPRATRIAALAYVHRHTQDREDFEVIAEALGLDDLLLQREEISA